MTTLPAATRHWGGFVLGGILAGLTDIVVLRLLTDGFGAGPILARPLSIAVAMIVSWQVNRRLTFAVRERATISEFLAFAAVSWVAQAINYAVFCAILLARPVTMQEIAIVLASLVSMIVSYIGFRFGVYRARGGH